MRLNRSCRALERESSPRWWARPRRVGISPDLQVTHILHCTRPRGVAGEYIPELGGGARSHEPQLEEPRLVLHEEGSSDKPAQAGRHAGEHVDILALSDRQLGVQGTRAQGACMGDCAAAKRCLQQVVQDKLGAVRGRELLHS